MVEVIRAPETASDSVELRMSKTELYTVRASAFSAYYDRDEFSKEDAAELRELVPTPTDALQSATVELSRLEVWGIARALVHSARHYGETIESAASARKRFALALEFVALYEHLDGAFEVEYQNVGNEAIDYSRNEVSA